MFKRVYPEANGSTHLDLAPQAVVGISVSTLKHDGVVLDKGIDDLDEYRAAYYSLDGEIVAIIHHKAEPPTSVSVYANRGLGPVKAQELIDAVLARLGIDLALIEWRETEVLRHHASA